MNEQDYMAQVMRTYAGKDTALDKLTLSALGLAGESGEVADSLKKVLYQGHHLDTMHIIKELGDVLWYLTLACNALGCTLEDVMNVNVEKLRKRYPNGFEAQRSINRNHQDEQDTISWPCCVECGERLTSDCLKEPHMVEGHVLCETCLMISEVFHPRGKGADV